MNDRKWNLVMRKLFKPIVMLSVGLAVLAVPGRAFAQAEDKNLKLIISKINANRKAIDTLDYKMDVTSWYAPKASTRQFTIKAKTRGAWQRYEIDDSMPPADSFSGVWMRSGKDLFDWRRSSGLVYCFELQENGELTEAAKKQARFSVCVDLLKYGFGDGNRSFEEAITSWAKHNRVNVVEEMLEGHVQYDVNVLAEDSGKTYTALSFRVDPAQGYFITGISSYTPDGRLEMATEVTGQPVAGLPGVFLPREIKETQFRKTDGSVISEMWSSISEVKIDSPFSEEDFSLGAMKVPDGTSAMMHFRDNTEPIFIVLDGKLLFQEVYAELMEKRTAPPRPANIIK